MEYSASERKEENVSDRQRTCTFTNSRIVIVITSRFPDLIRCIRLIKTHAPPSVVAIPLRTTFPLAEPMEPWFIQAKNPEMIMINRFYSLSVEGGEYFFVLQGDIFRALREGRIGLLGMTELGHERFLGAYQSKRKVTTINPTVNPSKGSIDFKYSTVRIDPQNGFQMERDLATELNIMDPWWLVEELCVLTGGTRKESERPTPRRSITRLRAAMSQNDGPEGQKIRGTR